MDRQDAIFSTEQTTNRCCIPAAPTKTVAVAAITPFWQEDPRNKDVVWIDGAVAHVGTDHPLLSIDGEAPRRTVRLRSYGIDRFAVTNKRFGAFVAATGYVSEAELFGWSFVFKDFVPPDVAESALFAPEAPWWLRVDGACWKNPEGPGTDASGRGQHPAVHISWRDATAFARWAGGRLPREAEWEHAAHGRNHGIYPWGDRAPDDEAYFPCNIWQGRFPDVNLSLDGHAGTAPVDAFEPNGVGLYNMVGNTWEWCQDPFRVRSLSAAAKLRNRVAGEQQQRLMKGGSYLCHQSYCHRYRIAARLGCPPDSATGHIGCRVVYDRRRNSSPADKEPIGQ